MLRFSQSGKGDAPKFIMAKCWISTHQRIILEHFLNGKNIYNRNNILLVGW